VTPLRYTVVCGIEDHVLEPVTGAAAAVDLLKAVLDHWESGVSSSYEASHVLEKNGIR